LDFAICALSITSGLRMVWRPSVLRFARSGRRRAMHPRDIAVCCSGIGLSGSSLGVHSRGMFAVGGNHRS